MVTRRCIVRSACLRLDSISALQLSTIIRAIAYFVRSRSHCAERSGLARGFHDLTTFMSMF